ncbi:MAG: 50S ribosomal protein L4 [Syntrophothermus sp.]
MPKVAVFNVQGQQVGEMALNDEIFGIEVNEAAIHDTVVMQLANRRQGTVASKTRGLVRGGGRKPWRQKGTGRARHGSIRSPLWVGGGTIFGPNPRSYKYRIPKKVRRLALKSALSAKVGSGELVVLDNLALTQPKTREMVGILDNLKVTDKALIVIPGKDVNVELSARNIPGVKTLSAGDLNVYDIVAHDRLVITKEAVAKVEEVLA